MANVKTTLDEWEVKDLENNTSLKIKVISFTELGNKAMPGIQVGYQGTYVNYEPERVEKWAYEAGKKGEKEYLLTAHSWIAHEDRYVKNYLVTGKPMKAKIEVKTRSSKPVIKEYPLPFEV